MALVRPQYPTPRNAMVVTDFPIKSEVDQEKPYCSASNMTLMGELHRVGIKQKDCYFTYLSYIRPSKESYDYINEFEKYRNLEPLGDGLGIGKQPFHKLENEKDMYVSDTLWQEFQALLDNIREVKPKLLIVTGKWSLFFLTGCTPYSKVQGTYKDLKTLGGLARYRASVLQVMKHLGKGLKEVIVFPMLPVTTKIKQPQKAPILAWDMKKAGAVFTDLKNGLRSKYIESKKDFNIEQDYNFIIDYLEDLIKQCKTKPTLLSVDIETRHYTIDCIGITEAEDKGICIAFSTLESPFIFTEDAETAIIWKMKELLSLKNARVVGQNFSYDSQYMYKFWLMEIQAWFDTMIASHTLYNYMPKSLDFLASVYCDSFSQWKDEQTHGKQEG